MSRTVQARLTAGFLIVTGTVALVVSAAVAWPPPDTDAAGGTCTGQGARTPIVWTVHNHETGHTASPAMVTDVATTPTFPTTGAGLVLPNTGDSTALLVTTVPAAFHGSVTLSYHLLWTGRAGSDMRAGGATIRVVACPVGGTRSTTTAACSTTSTTAPLPCTPPPTKLPPCGPVPSSTAPTTSHPPTCVPQSTTTTAPPSTTTTTICTTTTTDTPTSTSTTVAPSTSTTEAPTTSTTVPQPPPPPPSSTTPPLPPPPVAGLPGPPTTVAVSDTATLPVTGSSSGPLALAGAGMVAAGVFLVRRANQLAAT